jgi:hypothetical protein
MEPSVDRLIAHVEKNSDYHEPTVAAEGGTKDRESAEAAEVGK